MSRCACATTSVDVFRPLDVGFNPTVTAYYGWATRLRAADCVAVRRDARGAAVLALPFALVDDGAVAPVRHDPFVRGSARICGAACHLALVEAVVAETQHLLVYQANLWLARLLLGSNLDAEVVHRGRSAVRLAGEPLVLERRTRKTLRRAERLDADIEIVWDIDTGDERVWDAVCRIETASWKTPHGTSFVLDESRSAFMRELCTTLLGERRALVSLLWSDCEPVAYLAAAASPRALMLHKTSFDERYRRWYPGYRLLHMTLHEIDRVAPGLIVDFCSMDNAFAAEFARHSIDRITVAVRRRCGR